MPMIFTPSKESISLTEKKRSALSSWRAWIALAILFVSVPVSAFSATVQIQVLGGGGGGGGDVGGGGGAGGLISTTTTISVGTYSIVVGFGGAGGAPASDGHAGGTTTAFGFTSFGGGFGAKFDTAGGDGGSGGGGGRRTGLGGVSLGGGNNGGDGTFYTDDGSGGGGGGAGGAGESIDTRPSNGGAGVTTTITGTAVCYGGGGGGGSGVLAVGYASSTCGGGNGASGVANSIAGSAGTDGLGGGGGGGSGAGGAGYDGGDGSVIIRELTSEVTATGGTITTDGAYTVHTFTTSGSYVVTSVGIVGCLDTRATNYDPSAVTSAIPSSCTYPDIDINASYVQLPSHPLFTTTVALPEIRPTSTTTTPFSFAVESSSSSDPYYVHTGSASSLIINLMYPTNTLRKYVYTLGTFSPPTFSIYSCDSLHTLIGSVVTHASPFVTPAGQLVYVNRMDVSAGYSCISVESPILNNPEKIYAVIGSSDPSLVSSITSWASFLAFNVTTSTSTGITTGYLDASTTLPVCSVTDLSCHFANALQYVFVPSGDSVSKFKSLSLASSSPFSYAYDVSNVYGELFTTSTSSTLSFAIPFGFTGHSSSTITLISHAMLTDSVNYPVLSSITSIIRGLLTVLLWFGLVQFLYRQILQSHNKEVKV